MNRRKMRYVLTRKGLTEKANRAYTYVSRTIQTFLEYRQRLDHLVHQLVQTKNRRFAILGHGEVASLMEMSLKNAGPTVSYRLLKPGQSANDKEILLDCRLGREGGRIGIAVLEQLLLENSK
jgi:hypothetical protein